MRTKIIAACTVAAVVFILFNNLANGDDVQRKDIPDMTVPTQDATSTGRFIALRLRPGSDLRGELEAAAKRHHLRAAAIVTCVGSLNHANLRLANANDSKIIPGKLEIVSLTGTLSPDGVHLHISVSDETGKTFGGHLLKGSEIYTTAEIVIVELPDIAFTREIDADTTYHELMIRPQSS